MKTKYEVEHTDEKERHGLKETEITLKETSK
jgi:hypothetical protein